MDGGLISGGLIASTLLSAGAGVVAQKSAQNAADAASESQQNFLDRKTEDERQALTENSKRQQRNKQRYLANLRANQAASGFNTTAGTPLAMFGEIESRIDDEIDESTNRALDSLSRIQSQKSNIAFGDKIRGAAAKTNMMALGVKSLTNYGAGYAETNERYGADPFGIFN